MDITNDDLLSSKFTFKELTTLLESLSKIDFSSNANKNINKTDQKKERLKSFFDAWRARGLHNFSIENANLFPIARLLMPDCDRRIYNMKEAKLGAHLIKAFSIADTSNDAKSIINYRTSNAHKVEGDFAAVCFFALQSRCTDATMTIKEINEYLNKISQSNFKGKEGQSEIAKTFTHLCLNLSAVQLKWILRIILKDLKIGLGEKIVFDALHPDANEFYKVNSSLEEVCSKLNNPLVRSNEIGVKIDIPCCPMLGEKAKPNQIELKMQKRKFYIEQKLDGERFHLHKNGNKFTYFSRNRHNYTDSFGSDASSGSLTPYIYDKFSADVKNGIFDGEMCFYDMKEKIFLSLTEQYDIKSNREYENLQRCFCVFDILFLNDVVLTNKPLRERIDILKKCFTDLEGRIMCVDRSTASSNQHVVDALNNAIDTRQEGIVVKDPESVYKPDLRGGSGWFKVKPDYMLGLNDDLDLLIVGGYYGKGRRGGLLSHFLLAVAVHELDQNNKKNDEDDLDLGGNDDDEFHDCNETSEHDIKENCESKRVRYPKTFYSFAKIGSGYTYKELYDFNVKLEDKWKPYDKKNPPSHLHCSVEKPDVWIQPSDSFIVQVKAVEIVKSEKYKTGFSLRFPRLERIRDKTDKDWYDCMTLNELNELKEKNDGNLASGKHLELSDAENEDEYEPSIKKKRTINRKVTVQVSDRFKGVDSSMIKKESELFSDKEFCVINGNDTYTKKDLETKIIEHGGLIVQNPCQSTFCVIVDKMIAKCTPYKAKDLFDVVKIEWLINCIEAKRFLYFKPSDFFHCTKKTASFLNGLYDAYGDSYTENLDMKSIKKLFASFNRSSHQINNLRTKIAEIEFEYFPNDLLHFRIFRLDKIYLDFYEKINSSGMEHQSKRKRNTSLDLIELKIKWHGGLVTSLIDENTTHCVLDKNNQTNLNALKELNKTKKNGKLFHIVSVDWVNDSVKANRKLNELQFHL